jgi:inorganic triphosphatase YgiF
MREIELKLEVGSDAIDALRRSPALQRHAEGRATTRQLRSLYFDTADLGLAEAGIALRVRRVGRSFVQTVKCDSLPVGGHLERKEIEGPVPGEEPDLARLADPSLRAHIEQIRGDRALLPTIETEVRRLQRRLRFGGSHIELALDEGCLRTRAGELPIRELELELLEGEPKALYELALELQQVAALRISLKSKDARGRALITGGADPPRKATPLRLEPQASVDDALAELGKGCLEQILANWDVAYQGHDPEGVHQMRVGVRRLRSALSLFSKLLPEDALRTELRWLGAELGGARDWDVFAEETIEPLQRRFSADPGLKRLRDEVRARLAESHTALRRALDDPRATRLALKLGAWVTGRGWREQPLSADSARLFAPARQVGAELLQRRARRVRRRGRDIAHRTLEERHALRIQVKKLRYAVEFLGGLYPDKDRARRYRRRLSALQESLGELNDGVTAERLLSEVLQRLGPEVDSDLHRAVGFVAGVTARSAQDRDRDLPKCWKAFARLEPFWAAK